MYRYLWYLLVLIINESRLIFVFKNKFQHFADKITFQATKPGKLTLFDFQNLESEHLIFKTWKVLNLWVSDFFYFREYLCEIVAEFKQILG